LSVAGVEEILLPNSIVAKSFQHLTDNYNLVLSEYTIYEIEDVFNEKFPHKIDEMKDFIKNIPYELFIFNEADNKKYPKIRDINDLPVLINAIESNVDLFITGDKDFNDLIIDKPKIITPRKYIEEYIVK
jgi:predicted nucleic acid-binding protein